jgi:type II secretory pathway component GspD/PulD (secretin)
MMRLRYLCGLLLATLLMVNTPLRADDKEGPSEADKLTSAIKLYDAGDYKAAQQALRDIDPDKLTEESQQIRLQQYLAMARVALARVAEAQEDFEKAFAAVQAKEFEKAIPLFERVVKNEFAPEDRRTLSQAQLDEIRARVAAPPPAGQAAPPPAQLPAKAAQPPKGGGSLLDQLSEEYELLWQQAVKTFKESESKVRKAVLKEDFEEAHRLLDFAKQTIELNRRYASPPAVYEDYLAQAAALQRYVEDEERQWQEREVQLKQREIEEREAERISRISATKQRQIEGLMDQATELRKEQRFEDAIQVLDQVLAIDPENDRAAWLKETLGDFAANLRERDAERERTTQFQSLINDNTEAAIPWHENLIFPKNWPEITAKRHDVVEAAESEESRMAREKLRKVAPEIKFEAMELQEVINQLRALTGLNIVPNWQALDAAGISKDAEVTLKLKDVRFEKALQLILDEVGAGETQLSFEIDDGVVQVSTKEDLSRKTVTRVYNVQDLLITIPTFRGRQINLEQVGQNSQQGGIGGGRYVKGQGGASGAQGGMFQGGGGNQEDLGGTTGANPLEPIIELIRQTIDPESWREAGGNVGSIQSLNQQIIVTQTQSAHTELRDLLQQLRRARALQVAVESRFITISRNWLEQIGVDLDVVLNNGNAGFDRTTVINPATNNPILVPRQFTRNGFTPGAPGNVGINLPTTPFAQPYGQPGLVPATGNVGPAWGNMTPVPIVNNTMNLAAPSDTNISGSLGSTANSTPAFQIFGSFLDNIQVDFLLRASQIDRRSSDLDSPRLVLFNGQRATFEAFVEQDYIAALTPIVGDNAGMYQPQVDTAVSGRSLDVEATVSADRRYVTMTVRTFTQTTGNFRTVFFGGSATVGSGFIELATRNSQQIRTTVSVPDGGTLLIGGLKLSGERDVDAGVPILSRIPVLKRAFSNTSNVKDDQVLLILIKPTIIIQEEAESEAFPTLSSAK